MARRTRPAATPGRSHAGAQVFDGRVRPAAAAIHLRDRVYRVGGGDSLPILNMLMEAATLRETGHKGGGGDCSEAERERLRDTD